MLIYCDSCIPIYCIDHSGPWNIRATNRLALLAASGDLVAASDLVRLECRVRPISAGDAVRLAVFDGFFAPDVRLIPITTAVFDRATDIRARHRFKLADSLHLAAAIEAACHRFLTNDRRLSSFTDIQVEELP